MKLEGAQNPLRRILHIALSLINDMEVRVVKKKQRFHEVLILHLEAQPQYFSCPAMLLAAVSRIILRLYGANIVQYAAEWGIAQRYISKRLPRGVLRILGGMLGLPRSYRSIWGISAMISRDRTLRS